MKRRVLLAAASTLVFGGCTALNRTDPPSDPTTHSSSPTDSTTEPTTTSDRTESATTQTELNHSTTTLPQAKTRYRFGTWHEGTAWRWTIVSLDLSTTFQMDTRDETIRMPEDEQLGVATVKLENTSSTTRGWVSGKFGFIRNRSQVFEPTRAFEHPKFNYEVDIAELREVEHQTQFQTQGLQVKSGETRRMWLVTVLPRETSREDIQIGYDGNSDDEVRYPIRWTP